MTLLKGHPSFWRIMAHPNQDLAIEIYRCIKETDSEKAGVLAISPKRKGFVIPAKEAGKFELTPKGTEFCRKWLSGTKYSL